MTKFVVAGGTGDWEDNWKTVERMKKSSLPVLVVLVLGNMKVMKFL